MFLVTTTGGTAAAVTGSVGLSAAALLGGLGTGLLVYFLAWRRGIDGFRLILIGISVTAMMQAITTWLLTSADIRDVARAQVWLVGSLDNRSWGEVEVAFWGTLVLLVAVALVAFRSSRCTSATTSRPGWAYGSGGCGASCCSVPSCWPRWG